MVQRKREIAVWSYREYNDGMNESSKMRTVKEKLEAGKS